MSPVFARIESLSTGIYIAVGAAVYVATLLLGWIASIVATTPVRVAIDPAMTLRDIISPLMVAVILAAALLIMLPVSAGLIMLGRRFMFRAR